MNAEQKKFIQIDPSSLPKHFDAEEAELRWDRQWDAQDVYRYNPDVPREQTFVVDTPPPTVSGSLHIGHVFSYTHADVIVRYKRMKGFNIFYPMGWDDNGLPTERRVQNYFHVSCNPAVAYEENFTAGQASAKIRKKRAKDVSRKNFTELCLQLTKEDEKAFMELWRRIGLSVDWKEAYATIDDHCRQLAQYSFLDLYEKGQVYNQESPTMWDIGFQTAVAQAELEDRSIRGAFYKIDFGVEESERCFTIATTRPELLAACVGVTAHPDDKRYTELFGKRAITPLFKVPVPIFPSPLADPEKGTGIVMVCTFGDQTDVEWWKEHGLALRQIVGRNGRLLPVRFGTQGWESLDPDAANHCYEQLIGQNVRKAKAIVVEMLKAPQGSATGRGAPLQGEPEPVNQEIKFYEKGDMPLEFITTRQWFVRLIDKKDLLLEKGRQIQWHPRHMGLRYANWTENLQFDWCISRQRYFGVPFPVWYALDATGSPDYSNPILADAERLPVDPTLDTPPSYTEEQRDLPGGFTAETDVFDTWFTSSLSPQIGSHWAKNNERHSKLFPMDMRPQAHDIIRTWAFYTIAKAALHEDTIPWKHVVLSGWILDPDRKKMSKSKGNVVTPMEFVKQFTADGLRYWAANARLGTDTAFDQKMLKVGKRLVTKLFNAGKFVLANEGKPVAVSEELDRAFLAHLARLVQEASQALEEFDFANALASIEKFFWQNFTDTYLELVKNRAKGLGNVTEAQKNSAVTSLRLGLNVLLRLFAPMLPYITAEIWSWAFAKESAWPEIHKAAWPSEADFEGLEAPQSADSFDLAIAGVTEIRKYKTEQGVSIAREIEHLTLGADPESLQTFRLVLDDVMAAVHVTQYRLEEDPNMAKGVFRVIEAKIAEKT
ncbi:valine--tRNA ligase [candidate division KSB3 bacterium]|uniref:Valine--tRNA ligase n=1 Tax=candidate division KSB3 bacterium TaxID=2044937 RepID=A0A2G6E986_9BACT|nr:MAG: valine--tRNA ligase [candidate division KSB3 bacterium]PIE29563.1 MAG: valine--tRNA ligase [candidate division KSB3 bacterium]